MCSDGLGHSIGTEPRVGIQECRPGGEFDDNQFRIGIDTDELAKHALRRVGAAGAIDDPSLIAVCAIGVVFGEFAVDHAKGLGVATAPPRLQSDDLILLKISGSKNLIRRVT
jgi:hypothetical protein